MTTITPTVAPEHQLTLPLSSVAKRTASKAAVVLGILWMATLVVISLLATTGVGSIVTTQLSPLLNPQLLAGSQFLAELVGDSGGVETPVSEEQASDTHNSGSDRLIAMLTNVVHGQEVYVQAATAFGIVLVSKLTPRK